MSSQLSFCPFSHSLFQQLGLKLSQSCSILPTTLLWYFNFCNRSILKSTEYKKWNWTIWLRKLWEFLKVFSQNWVMLHTKKWYFVLFFFYDTSEEKFLTSDLSFSQVTEVDKREPRESFSKPRPHFWGRGRRPRPRNEQAEAEKCSPRFPFVYWGN